MNCSTICTKKEWFPENVYALTSYFMFLMMQLVKLNGMVTENCRKTDSLATDLLGTKLDGSKTLEKI